MNLAEAYLLQGQLRLINDHATELHDMIRPELWLLFQLLNVNYSWLGSPSLTWHAFESYRTA